jgi:DNA-binding MarR family transcriptional regulator
MTDKHTGILESALSLLTEAMRPHADIRVEADRRSAPENLDVSVQWKTNGIPKSRADLRLTPNKTPRPRGRLVWVMTAPLSSEDLDRLRAARVNFIHPASGSVYFQEPGVIVDRVLAARDIPTVGRGVDPFSDNASRVVRILLRSALSRQHRPWGVRELAAAAHVDRTTTSSTLKKLEQWNLVVRHRTQSRGRTMEVSVPDSIATIERWSRSYDWSTNSRLAVNAPVGNPQHFLTRFAKSKPDANWALTLQAAGAQIAPHAKWNRIHMYVDVATDGALRRFARQQGWEPLEGGRLILMRPFYRRSVWLNTQTRRGLPIVDVVQLILDLWRYPERGREQAQHILDLRGRLSDSLFDPSSHGHDS